MGNSQSIQESMLSGPELDRQIQMNFYKTKMKVEIAATLLGLSGALLFSYYALTALMKKMDPTNEEKQQSEEKVC